MSEEREIEYAELRGYLDYFSTHVYGIDPEKPAHPTRVGAKIEAAMGKSKALEGLKQAVNDTVEALEDLSPEYVTALDEKLREEGLITASEVRRRYSSIYRRAVKRGSIKNDEEYYVIVGLLADVSIEASTTERANLEKMVASYESST